MIPSPIPKALSSIRRRQVRYLLMGGQACILYGAAEFSRDVDIALLADPENLARLESALDDLGAVPIAVPPFEIDYLHRGHAIHFRCRAPGVEGLRVDVMSVMRGIALFPELWERRTSFTVGDEAFDVMSLPDLVQAKKTQRDKDWPMIRRLVEANYFANRAAPGPEQVAFWLAELRSSPLVLELAASHPTAAAQSPRPVVKAAVRGDVVAIERELAMEQAAAVEADREYWVPLRRELESLRRLA